MRASKLGFSNVNDPADLFVGHDDGRSLGLDLNALLEAIGPSARQTAVVQVHDVLLGMFAPASHEQPRNAPPGNAEPGAAYAEVLVIDSELAAARGGGGSGGGGGGGGGGGTLASYMTTVSAYNIRIDFTGTWTVELQQAFTSSADRLAATIVGDLQDAAVRSKGKLVVIDDIVISAELGAIDGVGGILGQAGPTAIRAGGTNVYLPATATMRFDAADAQVMFAEASWDEVVLHEMMHCVGFGTVWSYLGLTSGASYLGANAVAAYGALRGMPASAVPLETSGGSGTAYSHWSEAVFDNELMTGYLDSDRSAATPDDNALSSLSIAALADLGYTLAANLTLVTDPYVLPT